MLRRMGVAGAARRRRRRVARRRIALVGGMVAFGAHKVSESQAKQLLTRGRTGQMKGFRSKAGKPYVAALKLDGEHKVRLEFENQRK